MVKLSIIIVYYNNETDIENYLIQLEKQIFKDFEVIVVDNTSDIFHLPNLYLFLEEFKSAHNINIKVFFQGINNGYSGGLNYGIKRSSGDIILISNVDVIFGIDFLGESIKFLDSHNDDCDIMSPKIYYFSNPSKVWSSGGYFKFSNLMLQCMKNEKINSITYVDYVSGCSMFIRRNVLIDTGLFDKNFFMYFEDTDFCYRARLLDFNIVYNPEISLYHNISEEKERNSEFVKVNYFKSKILFILKHYSIKLIPQPLLYTMIIAFISFMRIKLKITKYLKTIISGLSLGLKIRELNNGCSR